MAVTSLLSGVISGDELDKASNRSFGVTFTAMALAAALTYEDSVNKTNISNGIIYAFIMLAVLSFVLAISFKRMVVTVTERQQAKLIDKIDKLTPADFGPATVTVGTGLSKAAEVAMLMADPDHPLVVEAVKQTLGVNARTRRRPSAGDDIDFSPLDS